MPVTVTVDAPESVTHERLMEWIRDLGFNPESLSSLLIERGGITVHFNARNIQGRYYAIGSSDETERVARNTVVIPVIES